MQSVTNTSLPSVNSVKIESNNNKSSNNLFGIKPSPIKPASTSCLNNQSSSPQRALSPPKRVVSQQRVISPQRKRERSTNSTAQAIIRTFEAKQSNVVSSFTTSQTSQTPTNKEKISGQCSSQSTKASFLDPEFSKAQQLKEELDSFTLLFKQTLREIIEQRERFRGEGGNDQQQELSKIALKEFTGDLKLQEGWSKLNRMVNRFFNLNNQRVHPKPIAQKRTTKSIIRAFEGAPPSSATSQTSQIQTFTDREKISRQCSFQSTKAFSLDPEFSKAQQLKGELDSFTLLFKQILKETITIEQRKALKREEEKDPQQELSKNALPKFKRNPKLQEEWNRLNQRLCEFFHPKNEKTPEKFKITLKSLGLEKYSSDHSISHSTHNEILKKESYQKAIHDFLLSFLLNLEGSQSLKQKVNTVKMTQFHTTSILPTKPTSSILFNYLIHLMLMSELLKILPQDLLSKTEAKKTEAKEPPIFLFIQNLIETLKNLEEVKTLEELSQSKQVKTYCHHAGDCLQEYVTILTNILREQIHKEEEEAKSLGNKDRTTELCKYLSPQLEVNLQNLLKTPPSSFAGDFDRIIQAQLLTISNENSLLPPPQLTDQTGKDKRVWKNYNKDLLILFMEQLQLTETEKSQTLELFEKQSSMANFHQELEKKEEEWKKLVLENPNLQKENKLKLLPFFRGMSQALLYGTHISIMTLDRFLLDPESKNRIIREFSTASIGPLSPNQKLEKDTKKLHFNFKKDLLEITLQRICALENPPSRSGESLDTSQEYFPTCEITSTTTLTTSLPHMESSTARTEIEIKCPPYTSELGLPFLHRYAALIVTLEIMKIKYRVVS